MNIVVACLVFFLAATHALAEEMEWTDGSYWPSSDQNQADLDEPTFDRYLLRIVRKPRPDQFYGAMGKRKFENLDPNRFIGLMGKRSNYQNLDPNRFIGLMGKRSNYKKTPFPYVGLMGKRSSSGPQQVDKERKLRS